MTEWKPIETAPFDSAKPYLIWLPDLGIAVTALPFNVRYAEDGNTVLGWDGKPEFSTLSDWGGAYMLPYAEEPTLWRPCPAPNSDI